MGIEIGHHALDRGIDQFTVLDGTNIVGTHPLEGVTEQVELAIGGCIIGALGFRQCDHGRGKPANHTQTEQRKLLHVPFAFPNEGRKFNFNQGAGDWPRPPWRTSK